MKFLAVSNNARRQPAFVHKPTIIFADEPTGALDSKSAQDLLHRLEDMNKQFNSTIMMVTHDPSAASYAESHYVERR